MNIIETNKQEPYLSYLLQGVKTIEGRLNKGKFKKVKIGDVLKLKTGEASFKVLDKKFYPDFKTMLEKEGVKNVLPDKKSVEEGIKIYYHFYTKKQEQKFGVLAFKLKRDCFQKN